MLHPRVDHFLHWKHSSICFVQVSSDLAQHRGSKPKQLQVVSCFCNFRHHCWYSSSFWTCLFILYSFQLGVRKGISKSIIIASCTAIVESSLDLLEQVGRSSNFFLELNFLLGLYWSHSSLRVWKLFCGRPTYWPLLIFVLDDSSTLVAWYPRMLECFVANRWLFRWVPFFFDQGSWSDISPSDPSVSRSPRWSPSNAAVTSSCFVL